MKKPLLFAVLVLISLTISYALPQSGMSAPKTASPAPVKIGPSAVWQPPQDFLAKAHAACDKGSPPNYAECFIDQMSKSGAPAEAVTFTRTLYGQSDGQVGIMVAFEKVGPVDLARVTYPLRANDNYGLLLLNGDPAILDVDDLTKLNRTAMEQSSPYQAVKQRYTATDIWPGDRSNPMWPQVKLLPDGGKQFIIGYPLINGCHACAHVGLARFSWDFDSKGKFLGTTYIPTPPPPKLMRPPRVTQSQDQQHPQPPAQPQPPQQSQPPQL